MNFQVSKPNFSKTNFSAHFLEQISQFEPKFDEFLASFSTWRCGGPADILVISKNAEMLEKLVILAIENDIPYTILGHASNVLISDNGIRGLVIINKSRNIEIKSENQKSQDEPKFPFEKGVDAQADGVFIKQKLNLIFDLYGVVLQDNLLDSVSLKVASFIEKNKEKYNFYYLSNITGEQFENFQKLEIYSHFLGGIASFQSQFEKPNPEIFSELLKKFDLKPEECIFIDDSDRNVETAEKLGINGIIYSYHTDLEAETCKIEGKINQQKTEINNNLVIDQIITKIQKLQTQKVPLFRGQTAGLGVAQKPFIIVIDGRGGSGKSTLATKLAEKLDCELIFKDKYFYFEENLDLNQESVDCQNFAWKKNEFLQDIKNCQKSVIIIEGCGSFEIEEMLAIDLKIWVDLDKKTSSERGQKRNTNNFPTANPKVLADIWRQIVLWQEKYISEQKPKEKADIVIGTENEKYEILEIKNLEMENNFGNKNQEITQNAEEYDIYITPRHSETGDPNFYSFADLDYAETGIDEFGQEVPITKSEIVFDSGVDLSYSIAWSLQNGLTGLQWFAGIPGTMGGALYNNIHGGTRHFSDNFVSCKVLIPLEDSENLT